MSEPELDAALTAFEAALAGPHPPEVETFLYGHPAIADRLRPLLETVMAVHSLTPRPAVATEFVGPYRLLREIGRGGMGVVYEAEDPSVGRRVALKVVRQLDPAGKDTLLREARIAAALQHPRIVPVLAAGKAGGVAYIAMQFIDGRPLSAVVAERRVAAGLTSQGIAASGSTLLAASSVPRQPLPPSPVAVDTAFTREVAALGIQAAEALAFVHDSGVLHRDVKPGNLLLDVHGHLWLSDFGLARDPKQSDRSFGGRVGTLRYASPEQNANGPLDPRTDIYSLGVTLYELLALWPPFAGDDVDLAARIATAEPTPLRTLAPGVPTDLETVVHKAMARRPDDRYPAAAELAADLKRFLAGEPVRAKPLTRVQRLGRWAVKRRTPLTWAAVAVLLGVVTAGVVAWRGYEKEVAARRELERREEMFRELLTEVNRSEQVFRHLPQGQAEHLRLVRVLKAVVCKWADEPTATAETKTEAVRACLQLGGALANGGKNAEGQELTQEALTRVTTLRATSPDTPELRFLEAEAHKLRAGGLRVESRLTEATAEANAAITLYEGLIEEFPSRANYRNPLSLLYGIMDDIAAAEGRDHDRVALIRKGLMNDQELANLFPTGHPQSYIRLAGTALRLGDALLTVDDSEGALAEYRQAVAHDRHLKTPEFAFPKTNREYTCQAPLRLASHLLAVGQLDEAGVILADATPDIDALAAEYTDRLTFNITRVKAHYLLGQWHFLAGRPDEAKAEFRTAIGFSHRVAGMPVANRLQVHTRQPFPELIDREILREELAQLERETTAEVSLLSRLFVAVGLNDRDTVATTLRALRQLPVQPSTRVHVNSLEAVFLARGGDAVAAKAALPHPDRASDGWHAICRKLVADAK